MRAFNRAAGTALLAILALQGCTNNQPVSTGGSIEEFARNLNGKRYSFGLRGQRFRAEDSAKPVTAQPIPKGLALGLAPVLKPGDRFQWLRPSSGISGPAVGMVVRVEGSLVFVQLDNLTVGGQQTRYIPMIELEPLDGQTPTARWSIN
jgi:hypothetical protein